MEVNNNSQSTQTTQNGANDGVTHRSNSGLSWRPSSFINVANHLIGRSTNVLDSPAADKNVNTASTQLQPAVGTSNGQVVKWIRKESDAKSIRNRTGRNTIVNIVLVEAKRLPDAPGDGNSHGIHCKFKMGSQTYKSKNVPTSRHPQWRERFKLNGNNDQLLHVSLWDKGRQKNFMGSCIVDLSTFEIERTHDIWLELDEGYGAIHLSITICTLRNLDLDVTCEPEVEDWRSNYTFYNVTPDLEVVGQLHVKVIGARGLFGKPNAYCTLELDNEKIQTPKASASSEPVWNKTYVFNIFDVASVLEVKVHDSSINIMLNDFLGRVSIPLLRLPDGESRWYALKDNSKRRSARGNCPRIRLETSLVWNPVTASLKLFRPKQVKYTAKPKPKFDIPLVYKNVKFIRDTFDFLYAINESFKRLFEWEDREFAYVAIICWLIFWYFFEPWMGPLLIAALFPVVYFVDQKQHWDITRSQNADESDTGHEDDSQESETMLHKVKGLPEMTFTITDGIEYMVSVAERLYNLAAFKVPFLSFLAMVLLVAGSGVIYFIPLKYQMIAFGLYKFLRKRIYPDRVLNNDLLDFISRIPDNKILKDWNELSVPEPYQKTNSRNRPSIPYTPSTPITSRRPGTPTTTTPTTPSAPTTPAIGRKPSTPTTPSAS